MHPWSARTCIVLIPLILGCSEEATTAPDQTADVESEAPPEGAAAPVATNMGGGIIGGVEHKQGTALIMLNQDVQDETQPRQTQEAILESDHVTVSGTLLCGGCTGETYLARVGPFIDPAQDMAAGSPPQPITAKKLDGIGAFTIAVPSSSTPIVLEVLADRNGDGLPSQGDRLTVHHEDGRLIPSADITGLKLDLTVKQERPLIPEDLLSGLQGADGGNPPGDDGQ